MVGLTIYVKEYNLLKTAWPAKWTTRKFLQIKIKDFSAVSRKKKDIKCSFAHVNSPEKIFIKNKTILTLPLTKLTFQEITCTYHKPKYSHQTSHTIPSNFHYLPGSYYNIPIKCWQFQYLVPRYHKVSSNNEDTFVIVPLICHPEKKKNDQKNLLNLCRNNCVLLRCLLSLDIILNNLKLQASNNKIHQSIPILM